MLLEIALPLLVLGTSPLPTLSEEHADGVYTVDGSLDLNPTETEAIAWSVLTDYDHLSGFMSGVRESHVEARVDGGGVVVQQAVVGRVLFLRETAHLLLQVFELPEYHLSFVDTSHRDFELYEGSYSLSELPGGIRLTYHLRAKPRADLPSVFGRTVFLNNAAELLNELRTEITRRAQMPRRAQ